jgi:rhodanese-related sulfurtransferase
MGTSTNSDTSFAISPHDLASLLGTPQAPRILDVRRAAAIDGSSQRVAAAVRCPPESVAQFAAAPPSGPVVTVCVYGHAVSQQAAAQLRAAGWDARYLAGGLAGGEDGVDAPQDIERWRSAGLPVIRKRPDLGVTGLQPSRWITRQRPKIDRIACPWLIRRFIDPHAEFFYVPTDQVLAQAQTLGAVAFDLPGAPISHEGPLCSFDALLAAFGLQEIASLQVLADVVRAADTDQLSQSPQAAGLLAFSVGLSALHATDDTAMLQAALPLYDALLAWARMQAGGLPETHNWKPDAMLGARA